MKLSVGFFDTAVKKASKVDEYSSFFGGKPVLLGHPSSALVLTCTSCSSPLSQILQSLFPLLSFPFCH